MRAFAAATTGWAGSSCSSSRRLFLRTAWSSSASCPFKAATSSGAMSICRSAASVLSGMRRAGFFPCRSRELVPHVDRARAEVDVLPAESEQLGLPIPVTRPLVTGRGFLFPGATS
jgi:hypothetical protein